MIFSDRVHRFFERVAKRYLESRQGEAPDAPAFYDDVIKQFANLYPEATRAEWHRFTLALVVEAHARGFDLARMQEDIIDFGLPDRVMNQIDRFWRDREPIDLDNPDYIVPSEPPNDAIITADQIRRMNEP